MIRIWLVRLALMALPFVIWFAWRRLARGRELREPPWPWLFLAGLGLVAISTGFTVLMKEDNRDQVYVPAETRPDGSVAPGGFRPKALPAPPPASQGGA